MMLPHYTPQTWVDNETILDAAKMQHIEAGITAQDTKIDILKSNDEDQSEEIRDLELETDQLKADLTELNNIFDTKKNLVLIDTLEEGWIHSSNGIGSAAAHWQADGYITVKVDVNNCEYITVNSDIYRNAFGIYVDSNNIVKGVIRDYQDSSKAGYVYSVVDGAEYAWFSVNIASGNPKTFYDTYGIVVLNETRDIATDPVGISEYPYNKNLYYADKLLIHSNVTLGDAVGRIYRVEKDGSGDFTRLIDAITEATKYNNSKVIVGEGTWDIIAEYGNEIETMSQSKRGLYLKNGVHVICSSKALIVAKYTGTNDTVREWFSAFNAGVGGFTLENARIETDNIRYSIHDERDSDSDRYTNTYINCDITHTNGFYVQCIGGGLGLDGRIVVDGCRFKGRVYQSQGTPLVSWHNSADGAWDETASKGAKSFIEIKGCYFEDKGGVQFINFGKSSEITYALVHGNSFGTAIVHSNGSKYYYDNIVVRDYLNEVRSV